MLRLTAAAAVSPAIIHPTAACLTCAAERAQSTWDGQSWGSQSWGSHAQLQPAAIAPSVRCAAALLVTRNQAVCAPNRMTWWFCSSTCARWSWQPCGRAPWPLPTPCWTRPALRTARTTPQSPPARCVSTGCGYRATCMHAYWGANGKDESALLWGSSQPVPTAAEVVVLAHSPPLQPVAVSTSTPRSATCLCSVCACR